MGILDLDQSSVLSLHSTFVCQKREKGKEKRKQGQEKSESTALVEKRHSGCRKSLAND